MASSRNSPLEPITGNFSRNEMNVLTSSIPVKLPALRGQCVGREKELQHLQQLLKSEDVSLVTLTGFGGAGKTTLALQVAYSMFETFTGGLFFIDLSVITEPALIFSTIAKTLHVQEEPQRDIKDTLKDFLANRSILFVLDNFEQLISGASVIAEFLDMNPNIKVIITSRESLRLRAEQVLPISPLPREEAVQLFVKRAQSLNPDFQLTEENASVISELCGKLDGLPLAIELAAMRTKMFSPQTLLTRLQSDLGTGSPLLATLTLGARDLPQRQQTLRNTIAWSYGLLNDSEKKVLLAAALFRSGVGMMPIATVAGVPENEALESLASLVDKHLIQSIQSDNPHFMMLESIREFAREQAQQTNQWDALFRMFIIYYRDLIQRAAFEIENGNSLSAMREIDLEHDNLLVALDEALASQDMDIFLMGIHLMGGMDQYWFQRCYFSEAEKYINLALKLEYTHTQKDVQILAIVYELKGTLQWMRSDFAGAVDSHKICLSLFEKAGNKIRSGRSMVNLGVNLDSIGDFAQAGIYYEKGLALAQQEGDLWSELRVKNNMGSHYHHSLKDPDRALACWQSALAIAESLHGYFESATIRFNMACLFYSAGDFERTTPILTDAIQIARDHQFPQMLAATCGLQAMVAVERKDFSAASILFLEAFEISHTTGFPDLLYELIEGIASLCLVQKWYEKLSILLAAIEGHTSLVEVQRLLPVCIGLKNAVDITRRAMGNESFERAWQTGKRMRYEELYIFAQNLFLVDDGRQPQGQALSMLTIRELETLRLLARGKSNEEISHELVVVQKTVEKHVANILRKLGVKNRTEAAAWAIENGLEK